MGRGKRRYRKELDFETVESSVQDPSTDDRREITVEEHRRLYPQLYAQIWRLGIPAVEVEDLIQETFLHAQRALDRGQFEGRSSFDTWVVSIAKRRTLKHRRRQGAGKRRGSLVSLEGSADSAGGSGRLPVSAEPDPQVRTSDRERLGRTITAIENLPEDFRAPLVLSVRGHTYDQIATVLGIPVSRVTSRIHQARAKLRKALAGSTWGSSG